MAINASKLDFNALLKELPGKSDKEKQEILLALRRLKSTQSNGAVLKRKKPETDDDLWEWIRVELGYEIPRVAVCEDHTAPFDYMCDYYFERERSLLVLGGRESAKTLNTAIINFVNSETKPGCESCVTEDTLIDCPRDHRKYPYGKPLNKLNIGDLVWSFNQSKFIFELKKVINIKKTRVNAPIFKLTIDDGSVIRSTGDHKYLKRNNEWDELCNLKNGDSLMPMYRDYEPSVRIRPDATEGGGRVLEYKAVANAKWFDDEREKKHVDHIDNNRFNSDPSNLQLLSHSEHCSKTMKNRNVGFRRAQQTKEGHILKADRETKEIENRIFDELKKVPIESLTPFQRMALEEREENSSINKKEINLICPICKNQYTRSVEDRIPLCHICKTEARKCPICTNLFIVARQSKNKTCSRGCGQILKHKTSEYKKKKCINCEKDFTPKTGSQKKCSDCQNPYFKNYERTRRKELEQSKYYNHKVVSVEYDGIEDVWDLEIEDNHNFVSCGVVLHNCTFADIEQQSNKSYSYIKNFVYTRDSEGKKTLKPSIEGEPLRKETRWVNGAKLEVIIGTLSGVNSPHPQKVHADEVDLIDEEVWNESRNMANTKKLPDGRVIKAQDIATSTLKSNKGLMQRLIEESVKAEKEGLKPTWKVYKSCVFEVAEEVPNCRAVPKDKRENRLKELGKDTSDLCECNKIAKGEWAEGVPRTLESVCRGKFFKSRGWMPYDDITGKFTQNTPNKWASQLECRRPMADGLYLPTWNRERYTIQGYDPRPEYGLIWQGIDWGGSANSAVIWIQGPLHQSLEVKNNIGGVTILPQGCYVVFKELNEPSMGATRLADKVVRQEIQFRNRFSGWRVKARFADMAGRQQRQDWHEHNPPLRTVWYISRDFDPTVECLQSLVVDSMLYVDQKSCPNTCDDFESWRQKNGKEVHDASSHNPAAIRYALKNATTIVKRNNRTTVHAEPLVVSTKSSEEIPMGAIPSATLPSTGEYSSERWRSSRGPGMPGETQPWMP